VDAWRLKKAKAQVDKHDGNQDCLASGDWRELVARADIDAVMITTPDHWHVPIALEAVNADKERFQDNEAANALLQRKMRPY